MVRIRLQRVGGKGQPSYRIVAIEKEAPRGGRYLEILGFYNPRTQPDTINVEEARVYDWMSKGAKPSESAEKIFKSIGLMDRYQRFQEGEAIEVLLEEAKETAGKRPVNTKTSRTS